MRGGGTDREEEEVLGRPASPDGSVEEEEIAAPEGLARDFRCY